MSYNRLKDKVAIVTGSTRGIGRAIALAYAREGAKVVVTGTKQNVCDELVAEIKSEGGEAYGIACDISKQEDIDRLFDLTLEKYGRLDISVHNAGRTKFMKLVDTSREELDRIWQTNLYGTFFCLKRAAEIMIAQGGHGKIINMSSITYETGQIGLAAYGATKAGIALMTKCAALELAPYKINVNAIGPGTILTDMNRYELDYERDEREIPLGIGKPEDIAGMAIFLATPEADYMTGHVVYVDGGYNIK